MSEIDSMLEEMRDDARKLLMYSRKNKAIFLNAAVTLWNINRMIDMRNNLRKIALQRKTKQKIRH